MQSNTSYTISSRWVSFSITHRRVDHDADADACELELVVLVVHNKQL